MAVREMAHEDYTVAWVCALALEAAAARAMLEKTHTKLPQPTSDDNAYSVYCLNMQGPRERNNYRPYIAIAIVSPK